jgi:hypothetical protein
MRPLKEIAAPILERNWSFWWQGKELRPHEETKMKCWNMRLKMITFSWRQWKTNSSHEGSIYRTIHFLSSAVLRGQLGIASSWEDWARTDLLFNVETGRRCGSMKSVWGTASMLCSVGLLSLATSDSLSRPRNPHTPFLVYMSNSPCVTRARIYRPSFRENKPKTLVFSHRKRVFWACFPENRFCKFGHCSKTLASFPNNMG